MASLLEENSHFMNISTFGELVIIVKPAESTVTIIAETRKDTLTMNTNKDENIDQLCKRVTSMLRAMANGEPRSPEAAAKAVDKKKEKTWDEQKATHAPSAIRMEQ